VGKRVVQPPIPWRHILSSAAIIATVIGSSEPPGDPLDCRDTETIGRPVTAARCAVFLANEAEGGMDMGGWTLGFAAALAVVITAGVADAQVVRAPDEIRSCLCKEQSVASLNGEVQAQSRAYESQRQSFEALDKAVQNGRPQVNVNNPADVDAFKRLLERRDAAADALAGPATRSYAEAVQRYNQAVSDYNGSCAGKAFDPDTLATVKKEFSCPKP
jgi:hypothetical protein